MKYYGNKRSLQWKIFLLAAVFLLLILLLAFQAGRRGKKQSGEERGAGQEAYQQEEEGAESGEGEQAGQEADKASRTDQEASEAERAGQEDSVSGETSGETKDSGKEGQDAKTLEPEINIVNLEEFAETLMGKNTYLLNQRLAEWVEENQLAAQEGTIFHVMVPQSDPQSINFYIRLSDERSSLVMLAYHPRENVVTASICNYTEEEIKNEVWEPDNGTAQRDAPENEAAAEGTELQEGTDDAAGEN